MFVMGSGDPLVLVPGIQGRWEWMAPAVRALSGSYRVVTFSLAGRRFDDYVAQVDAALDRSGVERGIICGVSYGGLVALRFAATRPERVAALVLASAPSPTWRPDERVTRYVASPWLSAPGFVLGAHDRLWREISAARPGRRDRLTTVASYLWAVVTHPASPSRMAARVRLLRGVDLAADAARVAAPTLVLTGDEALDRVVPVAGTREYLALVRGSELRTIERTGHIGLVTRPEAFAAAIREFARSPRVKDRLSAAHRGKA